MTPVAPSDALSPEVCVALCVCVCWRAAAKAMVSTGLAKVGYTYVNSDGEYPGRRARLLSLLPS